MSNEGFCVECKNHTDELFNWKSPKTGNEYMLCVDCVIDNNKFFK